MKIKDFQFAKYFLLQESDISDDLALTVLETNIEISPNGEPDTVTTNGDSLVYANPSSITMFLFKTLYSVLSRLVTRPEMKDKLGLGLLHMCRNYVYADYRPKEHRGPPVVLDASKLPVPAFVIKEIVEPLVGKLELRRVLVYPCNFTDVCRLVRSKDHLERQYNLPRIDLSYHDFPIVLCNSNIYNSPAQAMHLTIKLLDSSLGEDKTVKLVRKILLDQDSHVMKSLVLILKTLRGEPDYVINSLNYLQSHGYLTDDERVISEDIQVKTVAADNYLSSMMKTANPAVNQQVWKQWSQWSTLMGLIEKQLTPMRGSMWPTTENMKPFEDGLRKRIREHAENLGKTQANFEEMLQIARDTYNHNAVEPGHLIEHMLKDTRVWKK